LTSSANITFSKQTVLNEVLHFVLKTVISGCAFDCSFTTPSHCYFLVLIRLRSHISHPQRRGPTWPMAAQIIPQINAVFVANNETSYEITSRKRKCSPPRFLRTYHSWSHFHSFSAVQDGEYNQRIWKT